MICPLNRLHVVWLWVDQMMQVHLHYNLSKRVARIRGSNKIKNCLYYWAMLFAWFNHCYQDRFVLTYGDCFDALRCVLCFGTWMLLMSTINGFLILIFSHSWGTLFSSTRSANFITLYLQHNHFSNIYYICRRFYPQMHQIITDNANPWMCVSNTANESPVIFNLKTNFMLFNIFMAIVKSPSLIFNSGHFKQMFQSYQLIIKVRLDMDTIKHILVFIYSKNITLNLPKCTWLYQTWQGTIQHSHESSHLKHLIIVLLNISFAFCI